MKGRQGPEDTVDVRLNGDTLVLHSLSLPNLSREPSFDGRDTPSATARVACDERETVLALIQFGIWRAACFASDIFNCGWW
jgi:hypothetical protein